MRDAAQRVVENAHGMTYAQFAIDDWFMSAVIQHLSMIGEACLHLPEDLLSRHPEIPWREIRGMRHVVVHEYFRVDPEIMWNTVQSRLPELVIQLDGVLSREFPEDNSAADRG